MTTETSIYEYAKQSALKFPDKTAVWFYGRSISYRDLFELIDNVADHLFRLGIRSGDVVSIHLPNCPQAIMTVYAVAKLGGICNMVHPQIPADTLRSMMACTESKLLFTYMKEIADETESSILVNPSEYLPSFSGEHDAFHALAEPCEAQAIIPQQGTLAEKCAVYFHSSGTTGQPKTVMHSHAALNREVSKIADFYEIADFQKEVLIGIFPLFHCAGFAANMHLSLSGGAELVPMMKWDLNQAVSFIEQRRVTYLSGVPFVFEQVLRNLDFSKVKFRVCVVAGEAVPTEMKEAFRVKSGVPLFESYGMTENISACCSESRHTDGTSGMVAYPGCEMAVRLGDGTVALSGEGELLLISDTLMQGYFGDTAPESCFIRSEDGKSWFCTGDYGSIDDCGYIRFIRRIKNIIIRKGYNIYPEEIEEKTKGLPFIKDICAIGVPRKDHTEDVAAFIVLSDSRDCSAAEQSVRELWGSKLPRYSIPQHIRFIENIPRNAVEKVDRGALERLL